MRPGLSALALALALGCATKGPAVVQPAEDDPTRAWNAALAALHERGLSPALADPATGRIETLWRDSPDGGRERWIVTLEAGSKGAATHARAVHETDPPTGPPTPDPALAASVERLAKLRP